MADRTRSYDWGMLRMDSKKVYPSNQAMYGPYDSVEAAHAAITAVLGSNIPLGFKFGVVENGVFHEYVYRTAEGIDGITRDANDSDDDDYLEI